MISEYLDRTYVLSETRGQRDWLMALKKRAQHRDNEVLAKLRALGITLSQIDRVIEAMGDAFARAKNDKKHPRGAPYIPRDPVTCGLQAGLTRISLEHGLVEANPQAAETAPSRRSFARGQGARSQVIDATPALRLRKEVRYGVKARRAAGGARAAFIEGDDPLYALDGFKAKFGSLFTRRRAFNRRPARTASTDKSLTLFVFGDWGTGLGPATEVTKRIGEQLRASGGDRQLHVVHLGDVYYVGESDEYAERVLPYWPEPAVRSKVIGSWSLNGNHDMYSGGHGYFDALLRQDFMLRWHGDERGEPSSFFLIEDRDWQVFGLDTSWNLPSLGSAIFGEPTLKDYGGQNGLLTREQVKWMAGQRNLAKGCILLTHHQPAASRTSESQHADDAVAMLKSARIYSLIDAWIWGHEHRCVVFKPRAERTNRRLKDAPDFCACLGNAGVPVTQKNFEANSRISDVLWEEDRLDGGPRYEGQRVLPFGFGRIDTRPGAFTFRIFDHTGQQRYEHEVNRSTAVVPARRGSRRIVKASDAETKTKRKVRKKPSRSLPQNPSTL